MKFLRRLVKKIGSRHKKEEPIVYGIPKKVGGGVELVEYRDSFEVYRGSDCVKISKRHSIYLNDVLNFFDFHFNAVQAVPKNGINLVDYSIPQRHKVRDFDLFEVMFSSFAEGLSSTRQYLTFAQLQADSIVLDLGAYAGLTSIQFDMEIAKHNANAQGRVIAVDADLQNIPIITYNLEQYRHSTNRTIEYLYAACTDEDKEVEFSSEGNMGASLVDCVGRKRGDARVECVRGMSLSSIAEYYHLPKVDFIKCDIEGGEIFIFKDKGFFDKFSPKIIVEAHYTRDGQSLTADIVQEQLAQYGYSCKVVPQEDFILPIIECVRV